MVVSTDAAEVSEVVGCSGTTDDDAGATGVGSGVGSGLKMLETTELA